MIEAKNLTKIFDGFTAVDHIDVEIKTGCVFGLVGTNGAGKSTFLKMAAGILRPDDGELKIDGQTVFENIPLKQQIFYISDDQFFPRNAHPEDMAAFYSTYYPQFDAARFRELTGLFGLPADKKIGTFSKGMKKQLSVILGICANTRYFFCDETFDGLDPVMRQAVKSLIGGEMESRGMTTVIASHNLRELEDICDHVGLLHRGGIILSRDLEDMKLNIHKVQLVLGNDSAVHASDCTIQNSDVLSDCGLDIILHETRGRLHTLTVRGTREETAAKIAALSPLFYEIIPLSLEEIFISETEVKGYDIKKLVL